MASGRRRQSRSVVPSAARFGGVPDERTLDADNPALRTELLSARRPSDVVRAAALLRDGGVVALPTETVYGLAGNALDRSVVAKIYAAKGRPSDNPLIVHVAGMADVPPLVEDIPEAAHLLAERFWPGPLSMVLPKSAVVPPEVTGGAATVAVRAPDHAAFRAVLEAAQLPLAAPSANLAGGPSPTTASHVLADLAGRIDAVLDGGPCRVGVESTVVSLVADVPRLLRPGGVSLAELRDVLGEVAVDPAVTGNLPPDVVPGAPGMKYRHYAPAAPLAVLSGSLPDALAYLREHAAAGTAVLCAAEEVDAFAAVLGESRVVAYGSQTEPETLARGLFAALRALNRPDVTRILARLPAADDSINQATRNRLQKAAGFDEVSR